MLERFVDAAAVEAEIERVQSLSGDALRRHWQSEFGRPLPRSLNVDLLRRMIAMPLQHARQPAKRPRPRPSAGTYETPGGDAKMERVRPWRRFVSAHLRDRLTSMCRGKFISLRCRVRAACSSSERISFRQINRTTGNRLRQQLIDEETGEVVEAHDKARGYEIGKGQYLLIEDEELEAIKIAIRSGRMPWR
jgi:hypothetical protein